MTEASLTPEKILCIACGYDLRGLAEDGACPECGTSVARSRMGDRLAGADPGWLKRIALGQTMVSVGLSACLCSIVLVLIAVVLMAILRATITPAPIVVTLALVPAAIAFYGGLLACAIGAFPVTSLDPRSTLTEATLSPRRVARWAMVALLTVVTAIYALRFLWPVAQPVGVRMLHVVVIAFTLAVLMSAGLRHLASLLIRTDREELVKQTTTLERRLRWLIPLTGVLLLPSMALGRDNGLRAPIGCASIIAILALFSSATHLAVMMGKARSEFWDCLKQARAMSTRPRRV
jgi:hypothetical protein